MKRTIENIEREIVYQILICELCFDICDSIEIIPGKGSDFLPYYYNLNFTKGLLSLHSLLLSNEKYELSVKNYIPEYKINFPKVDTEDFEKEIISISKLFKNSFSVSLRHKIAAHIDETFVHADFTRAYMMPSLIPKYKEIISKLKNVFFEHCNHNENDYPFLRIKEQSDLILKTLLDSESKT